MRRSPPASIQLPVLAERKRPRAELTPDAPAEDDRDRDRDRDRGAAHRCHARVAAGLLLAPWRPDAAVRAPPRLELLES